MTHPYDEARVLGRLERTPPPFRPSMAQWCGEPEATPRTTHEAASSMMEAAARRPVERGVGGVGGSGPFSPMAGLARCCSAGASTAASHNTMGGGLCSRPGRRRGRLAVEY